MPSIRLPVHVRELVEDDLEWIGWSGGTEHVRMVGEVLSRGPADVNYVAVCDPTDVPLTIGCLDFARQADGGTLSQLSTHPALQSLGLGTVLIRALEDQIRARGLLIAYLSVEQDNVRAAALYKRLGYTACGTEQQSWPVRNDSGEVVTHVAECITMRKHL